jgi:manganese-dependent ADP-ribose/CDP-alcohol diphosphatase
MDKPIVSFGLISDVQYADHGNSLNYRKDRIRYYRNSINLVKEAVSVWHKNIIEDNFKFIIQLGDLIDGKCANYKTNALNLLLKELKSDFNEIIPDFRMFHVWGNHEFHNFKRYELVNTELNSARLWNNEVSSNANYYTVEVTNEIKLIVLDFYEFSTLGYDEDNEIFKQAMELLKKYNPIHKDLYNNEGLEGNDKRFIRINGGLHRKQLSWLKNELEILQNQNKKAIICGHQPIHPNATLIPGCLAWNYQEILDLINSFDKIVLLYFAGHDHYGHFHYSTNNILHITFDAILETKPDSNAFVTVKVFKDKIKIESVGVIGKHEISF